MKNSPSEFESNERASPSKDDHKNNRSVWKQMREGLVDKETTLRNNVEAFMLRNGRWFSQIIAILALLVTLLYMAITYLDNTQYPTIIFNWYIQTEKGVVIGMLIMYLINWYIDPDRLTYVYSSPDSIISLICIVPILAMDDLTMQNPLFSIIGIARYFRYYYFLMIILQHVELGKNEVD